MSEPIENLSIENATENLLALANMFRDDGKYIMAGALYRRAIAFLDGINPSETRQVLLDKILEDQSFLARKMACGHVALRSQMSRKTSTRIQGACSLPHCSHG